MLLITNGYTTYNLEKFLAWKWSSEKVDDTLIFFRVLCNWGAQDYEDLPGFFLDDPSPEDLAEVMEELFEGRSVDLNDHQMNIDVAKSGQMKEEGTVIFHTDGKITGTMPAEGEIVRTRHEGWVMGPPGNLTSYTDGKITGTISGNGRWDEVGPKNADK